MASNLSDQMASRTQSPVSVEALGRPALAALARAIKDAQSDDPFARVVVIAHDQDVARSTLHLMGAEGLINVTVQTGSRLSMELARPKLRPSDGEAGEERQPLNRLHQSQAVRRITDEWLSTQPMQWSESGRLRLSAELGTAFEKIERRPDAVVQHGASAGDRIDLVALHGQYRQLLEREGFYSRHELARLAADAVRDHWQPGDLPEVIYYLPRHPDAGELLLMRSLVDRGKGRVIIGLTGDDGADRPARDLIEQMGGASTSADATGALGTAVANGGLTVALTPDAAEEVRTVVRRIAAMGDHVAFHRIAVVHRHEEPYGSMVRQQLEFAGIPATGTTRRYLSETGAGRFLLGVLALAAGAQGAVAGNPNMDRETWIELIMSTRVAFPPRPDQGSTRQRVEIPATRWGYLARAARANGTADEWADRLTAYEVQERRREAERSGEQMAHAAYGETGDGRPAGTGNPEIDTLIGFMRGLATRITAILAPAEPAWQSAGQSLASLLDDYHMGSADSVEDDARIRDVLAHLSNLERWGNPYSVETLRQAVSDGLQGRVSERGIPVGQGVYVGPPAGIVGADYDTVFIVGMTEGQFPPARRVSGLADWLDDAEAARIQSSLERYEFLGAIASANQVVLSYPSAGQDRRAAYPSRWVLEAANLLHRTAGGDSQRLTSETLTDNVSRKPWLTVIASRERGLRGLAEIAGDAAPNPAQPADVSDYNLMHLTHVARWDLRSHPAWKGEAHLAAAMEARGDRRGPVLTPWDGAVGSDFNRVAQIGSVDRPISPSALETWAACPYKYFLSRVLGLSAPPDSSDEAEISALDRGSLVHRALERFVNQGMHSEAEMLAMLAAEFRDAEQQGITGYPLLWELEKEAVRARLVGFLAADSDWLGPDLVASHAEVPFDEVDVDVPGLGMVRFRGRIDRLDVLADGVRVRDFKTGNPTSYTSGDTTQRAHTVGNGRALQIPVYVEAARRIHPNADITGSYCFPLSDNPTREARPYSDDEGRAEFHETLRNIIGTARAGVFPATPEGNAGDGNCRYCDFNDLCPTRRRQIWERKGSDDPTVQPYNRLGGRAAIGSDEDDD